jgi:hypothetical protein
MTDSTGEWQVVGWPYTTAGGKNSHVRVQRVDKPGVTETRLWGSYEKVAVIRRATAEEGTDDATATAFSDRALAVHLDRDGLRRVRVGTKHTVPRRLDSIH